jgi:predicted Ser/Thr protein kinase
MDTLQAPARPPSAGDSPPEAFGRYRIEKELGRGGMGAVFLAHDTQLDRRVALKVPHFTPEDGPQILQRFHREARTAATLQHANICPVYEFGEVNGTPYLAMAFIEGRPLSDLLRRLGRPLSMRQAAALVRTLAVALEEAHRRKVIHRDLKPDNVMITGRGEPIIMDFGLALRDTQTVVRLTKQGTIMGTPAYMAPEQARGDPDQMGPPCDVYSLGVILYELLTRKQPFVGDALSVVTQVLTETPRPPSGHRPDVDPRLEAICLKAMAKQPEARYASMAEFAAALTGYLEATAGGGSTELPLAEAPSEPAGPPAAARKGWGGLAIWGAVAAAVAVAGIGYVVLNKGPTPTGPDSGAQTKVGTPTPAPEPEQPQPPPIETRPPAKGPGAAPDLTTARRLFVSDFAAGKNWLTGKIDGLETGFLQGRYFLRATAPGTYAIRIPVPEPLESFACQVVGRIPTKLTGTRHHWGLTLANAKQSDKTSRPALRVRIARNGELAILSLPGDKAVSGPVKPPSIKPTDIANTLLVVVQERTLEVYVNAVEACKPVAVPAEVLPARLAVTIQGVKGTEAEFEHVTVWSAADLPPPARPAASK